MERGRGGGAARTWGRAQTGCGARTWECGVRTDRRGSGRSKTEARTKRGESADREKPVALRRNLPRRDAGRNEARERKRDGKRKTGKISRKGGGKTHPAGTGRNAMSAAQPGAGRKASKTGATMFQPENPGNGAKTGTMSRSRGNGAEPEQEQRWKDAGTAKPPTSASAAPENGEPAGETELAPDSAHDRNHGRPTNGRPESRTDHRKAGAKTMFRPQARPRARKSEQRRHLRPKPDAAMKRRSRGTGRNRSKKTASRIKQRKRRLCRVGRRRTTLPCAESMQLGKPGRKRCSAHRPAREPGNRNNVDISGRSRMQP